VLKAVRAIVARIVQAMEGIEPTFGNPLCKLFGSANGFIELAKLLDEYIGLGKHPVPPWYSRPLWHVGHSSSGSAFLSESAYNHVSLRIRGILVRKPRNGWTGPVIASTLIGLMALGLTIYNAHLDRSYRELTIKPSLYLDVNSHDFQVGILNNGLGPAEIKRIASRFGDTCKIFDIASIDTVNIDKAAHELGDWFADPLDRLVQSIWEPTTRKIEVTLLTPEQIIAPQEKVILFRLQQRQLEAAIKKQESLDVSEANGIVSRFFERAREMPYYVEYCSLTGSFCRGAEKIHKECPHS
jgi:hypothetical protein